MDFIIDRMYKSKAYCPMCEAGVPLVKDTMFKAYKEIKVKIKVEGRFHNWTGWYADFDSPQEMVSVNLNGFYDENGIEIQTIKCKLDQLEVLDSRRELLNKLDAAPIKIDVPMNFIEKFKAGQRVKVINQLFYSGWVGTVEQYDSIGNLCAVKMDKDKSFLDRQIWFKEEDLKVIELPEYKPAKLKEFTRVKMKAGTWFGAELKGLTGVIKNPGYTMLPGNYSIVLDKVLYGKDGLDINQICLKEEDFEIARPAFMHDYEASNPGNPVDDGLTPEDAHWPLCDKKDIDVVISPLGTPACTCDIMVLMARGCQCGHLKKE